MDWASYAASLQVTDNDVVAIGNGGNGGNGGASGNGGNGGNGGTFHGDVTVDTGNHFDLGDYYSRLFDTAGNAGPTVWVDGRIVGGWAVRRDGRVVWGLLEKVAGDAEAAIAAEAERLSDWLVETHVIPRFPTPFAQELLR